MGVGVTICTECLPPHTFIGILSGVATVPEEDDVYPITDPDIFCIRVRNENIDTARMPMHISTKQKGTVFRFLTQSSQVPPNCIVNRMRLHYDRKTGLKHVYFLGVTTGPVEIRADTVLTADLTSVKIMPPV